MVHLPHERVGLYKKAVSKLSAMEECQGKIRSPTANQNEEISVVPVPEQVSDKVWNHSIKRKYCYASEEYKITRQQCISTKNVQKEIYIKMSME